MTETNAALAWEFGTFPREITRRSKANFASTDVLFKAKGDEPAYFIIEDTGQQHLVPRPVHDDVVNCFGRWIIAGRNANRHLLTNVFLSDAHATRAASKDVYQAVHAVALTSNRSYQEALQTLLGYSPAQREKTPGVDQPQFSLLLQYKSVLDELLGAHAYHSSDPYTDTLGGLVIDYFHEHNRVTVILSSDLAQVMTYVGGKVRESLFKAPTTAIVSVSTFLEEILADH